MENDSWNAFFANSEPYKKFLSIREGTYVVIRIIDPDIKAFRQHWFELDTGKKKPYNCAGTDCVACRNGHAVSARFALKILVRKGPAEPESFCTILISGYEQMRAIYDMIGSNIYDSSKDIIIAKQSNQTIVRLGNSTPLSSLEISLIENTNLDIDATIRPSTNNEIMKNIGQKVIFSKSQKPSKRF